MDTHAQTGPKAARFLMQNLMALCPCLCPVSFLLLPMQV